MRHLITRNISAAGFFMIVMVFLFSFSTVQPAHSHGGKTHGEESFTALQAVQKAIQLYDRLIVSGKLPEVWETKLKNIAVSIRNTDSKREYVVQFEITQKDPGSVYLFFDQDGAYSGSNFTGK
jgi:hypothetical protein